MSLQQRACKLLGGLALIIAFPTLLLGQTTNFYATEFGEYAPVGSLFGDQAKPAASLTPTGGFIVWQDNITDGSGLGISAVQLDSTFSATAFADFRVNVQGTNDQENPQVAMLAKGGAAFVWQGGPQSFQHIYARFLSASNLWITGDVQVNTATNYQANPVIAALTNGNVVVAYGSFGQDNVDGYQGVYAQILGTNGAKVGSEFQVNQFTPFNQRTPAVAAFPNGNFIVVWISEQERYSQGAASGGTVNSGYTSLIPNSVDVYARIFNSAGVAQGNEFLVSGGSNVCANPAVAVAADGTYVIAWSQKNTAVPSDSWDIYARPFSSAGTGGTIQVVNTQLYGDQFGPQISSVGTTFFVVWTSMGQDGSREGVFGQFLNESGAHAGGEIQVNTTVLNQQIYPAVASDGSGRFLAVWSSFVGGQYGLDLYAQRFSSTAQPLSAPNSPYVLALDSYGLSVSWPPVQGISLNFYELFVDGSLTPLQIVTNHWSSENFNPASTHTFQLAYATTDGRVSPLSSAASGTTWGADRNYDGLPDDWETMYFGTNQSKWPANPNVLLAPGVTVLDVFLWGANPTNSSTWLKQSISQTPEGLYLNWNTVPGAIYQVQNCPNLPITNWNSLGAPRFEAGTNDSVYLGFSSHGFYRIVRNRY